MELDEVIRLTKQALENVNHDKRVHTEFRFTVEQVKQLLEWLEDYKQLKADYIELDKQLRAANAENEELRLSLKISNDLVHCKIVGDAMWNVIIEKSKQMEKYLTKPPVPADNPCGGDSDV